MDLIFSEPNNGSGGVVVLDRYYKFDFTGAVTFSILRINHNFDRVPSVQIHQSDGQIINGKIEIDLITLLVVITFKSTQTGYVVLT